MPITDYKVTDIERDAVRMEGKADPLNGTLAQNQAEFDEYAELVRDNLDGLCDYIATMPIAYLSSSAAATANKGAITGFVPLGAILEISMTNGNTSASPTVSIDGVTHTFTNMPTIAQVQANSVQTYRFVKTGATALTFTKNPDYVCEYGATATGWVYEKKASGYSSCYRKSTGTDVNLAVGSAFGSGGLYLRSTVGTSGVGIVMPVIFSETPVVFATYYQPETTLTSPFGFPTGANPYTANVQIIINAAGTAGAPLAISFNAIGKWY